MENEHNLRFEFVGMLFALAIGQVAIECGDVIMKGRVGWEYAHIYTHLLLGTVIIATSWVGWQTSHSFGNTRLIRSNFSQQFIILLIDIFLVICYFIVVRGAEEYYKEPALSKLLPEGKNQTLWSLIIFSTYLIWDILTKLLIPYYKWHSGAGANATYIKATGTDWQTYANRAWQTAICLTLSWLAYHFMRDRATSGKIVSLDLYLIAVFFLFRGLKETGKSKEYISKIELVAEIGLSKATQAKIKGQNANVPQYPLNVVNTKSRYRWRVLFFVGVPSIGILISTYLYFHL